MIRNHHSYEVARNYTSKREFGANHPQQNGVNRGLAQCAADGSGLRSLGDCGPRQHCQVTANAVACFAD